MGVVERWFGDGFAQLHPEIQRLHRHGGTLSGVVRVRHGRGIAGWLGARIARRLGIGPHTGDVALHVAIRSDDAVLHWDRRFGAGGWMRSEFHPVGAWPDGYWIEKTGAIALALMVDTDAGGWRWRPLRGWIHGLRVPMLLLPRVIAYKAISDGQYVFHVSLSLPLIGVLLAYEGRLQPQIS